MPLVSIRKSCGTVFGRQSLFATGLVWMIVLVGCSEDLSIRKYRVAKSDARRGPSAASQTASDAAAREQQMLAAIVPNKDTAWFFKLTGDPDTVGKHRDQFKRIVHSVQFGATGSPSWQLAEGWEEQRLQGITYANLTNRQEGLTATVTQLPFANESTEEKWREYIVSNINRWRNQLALENMNWEELQPELEEVKELSQGPAKAYFVSLLGRGSGSMGTPPMMRGLNGDPSGTDPSGTNPSATDPSHGAHATDPPTPATGAGNQDSAPPGDLTYTSPSGWRELPASGMRRAAFAIESDIGQGEVTLIPAGGSIEANIAIWLGQVSVEASPANQKTVLDSAEPLEVNGVTAPLYTLQGQTDQAPTILIADIPWQPAQSLFVKFKGDQALAQAQRENFIEFVKSIQW